MSDAPPSPGELRALCRRFLTERAPLALLDDATEARRALWDELGAMGWASTLVPERAGGLGWSWEHAAVVAQELGRTLAPVPFLGSALVASSGLRSLTDPAALDALSALAAGSVLAVAGLPSQTRRDEPLSVCDGRVSGESSFVLDAAECDCLLVVARDGESPVLALVDAMSDVLVEPLDLADQSRSAVSVVFRDVAVTVLAKDGLAHAAIEAMETALLVGLACDALGGMQYVFERSVEYAGERVQFGRPIGSFQAIKHRLADLYVLQQGAIAIVDAAVAGLADPDGSAMESLAHAYSADAYARICGDAVLVHGAIGFTWEHPLHRYLKRALLNQHLAGPTSGHRERHLEARLAALSLDPR